METSSSKRKKKYKFLFILVFIASSFGGIVYATSSYWMQLFFSTGMLNPFDDPQLTDGMEETYFSECTPAILFKDTPLYDNFDYVMKDIDQILERPGTRDDKDALHGFQFRSNSFFQFIDGIKIDAIGDLSAIYDSEGENLVVVHFGSIYSFDKFGRQLQSFQFPKIVGGHKVEYRNSNFAIRRDPLGRFWIVQNRNSNSKYKAQMSRLESQWPVEGGEVQEIPIRFEDLNPNEHIIGGFNFSRTFTRQPSPLYVGWGESAREGEWIPQFGLLNVNTESIDVLPPPPIQAKWSHWIDLHNSPPDHVVALWAEEASPIKKDYMMNYRVSYWDSRQWTHLLGDLGQFRSGNASASIVATPRGEIMLASIDGGVNGPYFLNVKSWDPQASSWKVVNHNEGGGLSPNPKTFKARPRLWFHQAELYLSWTEKVETSGYSLADLFFAILHDGTDPEKLRNHRTYADDIFVLKYDHGTWIDVMTSRNGRRGMLPGLMSRFQHTPVSCI